MSSVRRLRAAVRLYGSEQEQEIVPLFCSLSLLHASVYASYPRVASVVNHLLQSFRLGPLAFHPQAVNLVQESLWADDEVSAV